MEVIVNFDVPRMTTRINFPLQNLESLSFSPATPLLSFYSFFNIPFWFSFRLVKEKLRVAAVQVVNTLGMAFLVPSLFRSAN